jgi:hypothetical protein
MHPLMELEAEYFRCQQDPEFQTRTPVLPARVRRPPHPAVFRRTAHPRTRRGQDLSEARRPAPHRRPQDQQRPGPGAHRQAHGQDPGHRRDRRRPARRGHRHRRRHVRPEVRDLHGGRRLRAPGVQRLPHEDARRRGGARSCRSTDAEGGRQRGDARLGHPRPHTHYILGTAYGAHPYPVMVRNFHRVIGDEARRQILEKEGRLPDLLLACVGGGSNAIGLFLRLPQRSWRPHVRRRSRRPRHPTRATRRPLPWWLPRRASGDPLLHSPGRERPDPTHPQRQRRSRLRRRRSRNTPGSTTRAGSNTPTPPTNRPWRPSCAWPGWRASFRRSNPPTPSASGDEAIHLGSRRRRRPTMQMPRLTADALITLVQSLRSPIRVRQPPDLVSQVACGRRHRAR